MASGSIFKTSVTVFTIRTFQPANNIYVHVFNICFMRVSVISALSDMKSRTGMCFIDKKTEADIFMATKCLNNCSLAIISLNYGNLILIYHTLGEICTSNQAEILSPLNYC